MIRRYNDSLKSLTFGVNFVQRDDDLSSTYLHKFSFQEFPRTIPSSNTQGG